MYSCCLGLFCSPQVLETCVNHCGERFHNEIAKFRFLNELIKVLSPKVGVTVIQVFQVGHTVYSVLNMKT